MIYLVSVIILLSLIVSGIFLGTAPSMHNLIETDLLRRASANAKIEGLQLGQLLARSNPDNTNANLTVTSELLSKNGSSVKKLRTEVRLKDGNINVRVSAETPQ
jgi:hypothetical protein